MQTVSVRQRAEQITLGQFLKLAGSARTGGEAKGLIQAGRVTVNGEVESRRGRRLADGDRVIVTPDGAEFLVSYSRD